MFQLMHHQMFLRMFPPLNKSIQKRLLLITRYLLITLDYYLIVLYWSTYNCLYDSFTFFILFLLKLIKQAYNINYCSPYEWHILFNYYHYYYYQSGTKPKPQTLFNYYHWYPTITQTNVPIDFLTAREINSGEINYIFVYNTKLS